MAGLFYWFVVGFGPGPAANSCWFSESASEPGALPTCSDPAFSLELIDRFNRRIITVPGAWADTINRPRARLHLPHHGHHRRGSHNRTSWEERRPSALVPSQRQRPVGKGPLHLAQGQFKHR